MTAEADQALEQLRDAASDLADICSAPDALAQLLDILPARFPEDSLEASGMTTWSKCAEYFCRKERWHEGLGLYWRLYEHAHAAQDGKKLLHKGHALVWISDCFRALGHVVHAKRYLMLTLCEDAVHGQGKVDPNNTGVYWRLVWQHGLPEAKLKGYAASAHQIATESPGDKYFPEAVLQRLDNDWMTELPSASEATSYRVNRHYVDYLQGQLGTSDGKALEQLADYLMACMPGCRTQRRLRSPSTDYDVVCAVEGVELDFRSEFGRYFVCECKDWRKKADFTTMAKFCRVLDSTKSRFGIIFTSKGITGERQRAHAALEQLKVFQDRGAIIVAVDEGDLKEVAQGKNLIALLRTKYEDVRLDLTRKKK